MPITHSLLADIRNTTLRITALLLACVLVPAIHAQKPAFHAAAISEVKNDHPLILIGFMGGNVKAGNLVHKEALVAQDLQQRYPAALHAAVFANHDWPLALKAVLNRLDSSGNGHPSTAEKNSARIVIYGHSWGASETVALARRLNNLNIPVLLTIQVDSVKKLNENDENIPPNVHEAINFYQTEGLLHGRSLIKAMDAKETNILGNYESTYRKHPVSCTGYPWFARTFMKQHIEIENDSLVWNKIEALIQTKVLGGKAILASLGNPTPE